MTEENTNSQKHSNALPAYQPSDTQGLPQEDMNSTMMGIDLKSIQNETQQNIRVDSAAKESLVQTSRRMGSFFSRIFRKKTATSSDAESWVEEKTPHDFDWKPYVNLLRGIWLPEAGESRTLCTFFYVSRLMIVVLGVLLFMGLIHGVLAQFLSLHPDRWVFLATVSISLAVAVFALVRRSAATWLVTAPFAALTFLIAWGAFFYNTSDSWFLSLAGLVPLKFLNLYFVVLFVLLMVLFLAGQTRSLSGKILWGVLLGLSLLVPCLNQIFAVTFEESFWGYGPFTKISHPFLQPAYLFVNFILPLWFVLVLAKALFSSRATKPEQRIRGIYLSFVPLFFMTLSLGFVLLQNNRVFHVLNFFVAQKLPPALAEFSFSGHNILLQTRATPGFLDDRSPQYRIEMVKPVQTTSKQYNLKVWQPNGLPLRGLKQNDFQVFLDGVATSDFQILSYDQDSTSYLFKMDLKAKDQPLSLASYKKDWAQSEALVLDVTDPSVIQRVSLLENGQVVFEKLPPFAEKLELPLAYLSTGEHVCTVLAFGTDDQEIARIPIKINIQESRDFFVVSPFSQDDVGQNLTVVLQIKSFKPEEVRKVVYRINGKVSQESSEFAVFQTLDLSAEPDGEFNLSIDVEHDKGVLTRTIPLRKVSTDLPSLEILSPTQGVFAQNETPIVYELSAHDAARVLGVRVEVNGMLFEDFEVKENQFILPTARWKDHEIYVSMQSTLDTGQKVSDWVQINRGVSALKLQFQTQSLAFLSEKKLAFLLDASASMAQFWQGKARWDILQDVIFYHEVQNKIADHTTDILVLGGEKPAYFLDCQSVHSVLGDTFSKTNLKKQLESFAPMGVSPILKGLEQALQKKPDKIFVMMDDLGVCDANFSEKLSSLFAKNPQTHLVMFALGFMEPSASHILAEAVQKVGGDFFHPDDYDDFLKTIRDELSVSFLLYSEDKLLQSGSLKDQEFSLSPGDYTLQLPFADGHKTIPVHLDHGLKTTFGISGKGGKIHVESSVNPL